MKTQTAVWICPKLCGCKVRLTAAWVNDFEIEDGENVSYRHPIPNTISALDIVAVCVEHQPVLSQPIEADPYRGAPGYINPLPSNPTDAEKLYIYLFRYSGARRGPDTCGCKFSSWVDRTDVLANVHFIKGPSKDFRKCEDHLGLTDDDAVVHAILDVKTKSDALNKLLANVPRLKKEIVQEDGNKAEVLDPALEYLWSFSGKDDRRSLIVEVKGANLNKAEKDLWKDAVKTLDKQVTII